MLCQLDEYRPVTTDGQRLRSAREKKGLTQKELAAEIGIDHTYLSRIERDDRRMYTELADKAARVLGITRQEILSDEDDNRESVSIVGYVGAGEEVRNEPDPGAGISRRQLDGVTWTPRLVGVVVRGESMAGRCEDGDLIIFEQTSTIEQEAIGHVSVVHLQDGRTFVKQLFHGSSPGRFTLGSRRGPPLVDVDVMWAARVRAYLPR